MVAVALLGLAGRSAAIDNGLGTRPPMGWRSWNAYKAEINQDKMVAAAHFLSNTGRALSGRSISSNGQRPNAPSLKSLGYDSAGLDDGWQACGAGVGGSFHNSSGWPLVNTTRFPSMSGMTAQVRCQKTPQ